VDLRDALRRLLEAGGDERSVTDPKTGLTKYCTQTSPCSGIFRSSCTSNVVTSEAFNRGVDVLRQLLLEARNISKHKDRQMIFTHSAELFRKMLCDVRERIRALFEISFDDAISLFPSGTDAELMPALLALTRALTNKDRAPNVFSVVTASGEVGSGTMAAATGKEFSKLLPCGSNRSSDVAESVFIDAFSGVALLMRDGTGQCISKDTGDQLVEDAVRTAAATTGHDGRPKYGSIVVHLVLGSKTGQCMPSEECLERLMDTYGSLITPVVDACQGRLGAGALCEHLSKGRIVLCTGSKFFGGPAFSGACFMNSAVAAELERLIDIPEVTEVIRASRLKDYVVASLVSYDLPKLRSLLPLNPLNYGVLMRWTVALHGMEIYFAEVPADERTHIMTSWVSKVRSMIKERATPLIQVLEEGQVTAPADEQTASLSTIVSFHCRCMRGKPQESPDKMSLDELRKVQLLMASDLTQDYPELCTLAIAKTRCFIGQPVDLHPPSKGGDSNTNLYVLRVAFSAPLVTSAWNDGLEVLLEQDRGVFEKLNLILSNWFSFEQPRRGRSLL